MTTLVRSCVLLGCSGRRELEPGAYACGDCQVRLVRKLADIGESIISAAPVHGAPGPHAKGYRSTPPLRLDVVAMLDRRTEINGGSGADIDDDVLDDIPNVGADLGGWVRVLAEEHPDFDGEGWNADPIAYAWGADLLRSRCDWVVRQPWVDEFAADIARVHGALRAACCDLPDEPVGMCLTHGCDGRAYPTRERDGVRCARCRRLYRGHELVQLRLKQPGAAA
jgi:hypothetical protein